MRPYFTFLCLGIFLFSLSELSGGESPAREGSRATDALGDPLPPGAVGRLGSARLHDFHVHSLAFSPDGKTLASGGGTRGLCLWEFPSGKRLHSLEQSGRFGLVAFAPDGKYLAYTAQGEVRVYRPSTGKIDQFFTRQAVCSLAVSPDGKTVAAGEGGGGVRLWSVTPGKELRLLQGREELVESVAYSPDGKFLASAGKDGGVCLWDPASGTLRRRIFPNGEGGRGMLEPRLAFAPGGKLLAVASSGGTMSFWEVESGKEVQPFSIGPRDVQALAFAPGGRLLATGDDRGSVELWNLKTGKKERSWRSHTGVISSIAFAPDGNTLATAAYREQGPRLWDPSTGREVLASGGHHQFVLDLVFSVDGKEVLTCAPSEGVLRWDLATGQSRSLFDRRAQPLDYPILTPEDRRLAFWRDKDKSLRVRDAATGKLLTRLSPAEGVGPEPWGETHCAFAPEVGRVAIAGPGMIHVLDTATNEEISRLRGGGSCLALSADGQTVALVSGVLPSPIPIYGPGKVHLWDVAAQKVVRTIKVRDATLWIAFSFDGRLLASGGRRGLQVWEVATGEEIPFLALGTDDGTGQQDYNRGGTTCLTFSPDGRYLASGDETKALLQEVLTGKVVRTFEQPGLVSCLRFSPDGRVLASGGEVEVHLWDVTGRQIDKRKPEPPTPDRVAALWADLAKNDAVQANRALWDLTSAPGLAVPHLRKQLRPIAKTDGRVLATLIAGLDDEKYAVREQSMRDLEKLQEVAEPALRKHLQSGPTLESRRRIELLLAAIPRVPAGQRLQALRGVQVLERIGSDEAAKVLADFAEGAPEARLTQEAAAALRRLSRKPSPSP
jgi:WD40 repeat protein